MSATAVPIGRTLRGDAAPAEGPGDARRRIVARVVLAALVLGAFGLGLWGMSLYLAPAPGVASWRRDLDLVYYSLQLFVMGSDPLGGGGASYPWQLQLARFAAPAATVYAVAEAIWLVLGDRMARRRLRRRRNHTIVIGTTAIARAIAEGLASRSDDVVLADAGDPQTLLAHGIAGAAALYACDERDSDSGVNVGTVLEAAALRPDGGLRAFAHVSSPAMALALRARRLGLPRAEAMRLDFFNVDEVAARLVVGSTYRDELDTSRVLIVGYSTFAHSLLIELARRWRVRRSPHDPRPVVTLVDEQASRALADIVSQQPLVREVCDIEAVDAPIGRALDIGAGYPPATAYICCDDEELALRTALTAAGLWHGGQRSLVVRLNVMSRLGTAFAGTGKDSEHGPGDSRPRRLRLLDDLGGRLLLVGVTEVASDALAMVEEDLVERMAQAIHEHYLVSQRATGTTPDTSPAMVEWTYLDEDRKHANRSQAGDIGVKLDKIGCTAAPYLEDVSPFMFTQDEVELLARHEHDRWMAERRLAGWTHAAVRDDVARQNPAMLAWDELLGPVREQNRDAVRALPAELASIGLRVVRLRTPGAIVAGMEMSGADVEKMAEAIHQLYLKKHGAEAPAAMTEWVNLSEELRAVNRAQAEDIPRKLNIIGCEISAGSGAVFSFTADELDVLTRLEHDRWCAHWLEAGWSFGPVHDAAGKHRPELVAFDRLSSAEQDKDRDAVVNMPSILAAIGLKIVRKNS